MGKLAVSGAFNPACATGGCCRVTYLGTGGPISSGNHYTATNAAVEDLGNVGVGEARTLEFDRVGAAGRSSHRDIAGTNIGEAFERLLKAARARGWRRSYDIDRRGGF